MQARSRVAPIARMLGVTVIVAFLIVAIHEALRTRSDYAAIMEHASWIVADLVHIPQFLLPLALIWMISRGRLSEYGFNLNQKPPIFTHARMLGLGAFFGLLMSVGHIASAVKGTPLDLPRPVTTANILGNLTFQWIVVGLSEETMFRGLIQTYLMRNLEGRVRFHGHDLHMGTVVGAVIWGLFHFINILIMPLGPVLLTVALTIVAGLLMGYAYQETGSLLTTMIVHNTMFGLPLTVGYVLYWLL